MESTRRAHSPGAYTLRYARAAAGVRKKAPSFRKALFQHMHRDVLKHLIVLSYQTGAFDTLGEVLLQEHIHD